MIDINVESIVNRTKIKDGQAEEILNNTGFNILNFEEIVELQKQLNEKVDIDWIDKNFDWNHAALLESNELLDSFDWKWWKKGETDWANIEIEMLDLFHFLLAKSIVDNNTHVLSNLLLSYDVKHKDMSNEDYDVILANRIQDTIKKQFIPNILNNAQVGAMLAWVEVWYRMGYNSEKLFRLYKMKYTLNIFRQDNGYKDGTYIKMWNGVEDNVFVQLLSDDLELNESFIDELYIKLTSEYSKVQVVEKSIDAFIETDPKWKAFMEMVPIENKAIILNFGRSFQNYLEK